jgi:hypothetical protein
MGSRTVRGVVEARAIRPLVEVTKVCFRANYSTHRRYVKTEEATSIYGDGGDEIDVSGVPHFNVDLIDLILWTIVSLKNAKESDGTSIDDIYSENTTGDDAGSLTGLEDKVEGRHRMFFFKKRLDGT